MFIRTEKHLGGEDDRLVEVNFTLFCLYFVLCGHRMFMGVSFPLDEECAGKFDVELGLAKMGLERARINLEIIIF